LNYETLQAFHITELYIACHDFDVPVTFTLIRMFPQLALKGLVISDAQVFSDTFRAPLAARLGNMLGRVGWFVRWRFGSSVGTKFIHHMYTKNTQDFLFERLQEQLSTQR
jgi:hypothetical protein